MEIRKIIVTELDEYPRRNEAMSRITPRIKDIAFNCPDSPSYYL